VVRRAKQHRLLLEDDSFLARLEHLIGDITGLLGLVAHGHEQRLSGRASFGPQVLREPRLGLGDHSIGSIEDHIGRAVVAVERDHASRRGEPARKVEDVPDLGCPEGTDRLGVVTDDSHAATIRLKRQKDRFLQAVRVLILVHQYVVEPAAEMFGNVRFRAHLRPPQQEILEPVLAKSFPWCVGWAEELKQLFAAYVDGRSGR